MNEYDKLVAQYILRHFRSNAYPPWGSMGGKADTTVTEEGFQHLKACEDTVAVVTDIEEGPISEVTPDPQTWLTATISCPHNHVTEYGYSDYGSINEVIAGIEWFMKDKK